MFRVPYRLRVVAVAAALFASAGLGGGEGAMESAHGGSTGMEEQVPADDGALEIGSFTQGRTFLPYTDGEEEFVEMGLQGGFHIFVDGRLRPDTQLSEVVVELGVSLVADGSEVTRIRHQRTPDIPDANGWPTLPEMIIFIPDPTVVDGQDVRIDVQLEAVDGALLDVLDARLYLSRND